MAEEKEGKPEKKINAAQLKKILFLGLLLLNVLATGAGGYLAYISTIGYKSTPVNEAYFLPKLEAERKNRQEQPIIYTMDPFTVNLKGQDQKVMRLVVSLGMLDEKGFEEVVTLSPEARDAIIRILQDKSYTDIESIQGKLFLDEGVVKDVYFSQLIAQ